MENILNVSLILSYIAFSIGYLLYLWKTNSLHMNAEPLTKQSLFHAGMAIPILGFFIFGIICWSGYNIKIDADGFNNFLSISKLPLGILSLSIPFGVVINNIHRTIQTDKQIKEAERKNKVDTFFSHRKNTMEIFEKTPSPKLTASGGLVSLKFSNSYVVYRHCYPNSSVISNDFTVNSSYLRVILKNLTTIMELEKKPPSDDYFNIGHWIWGVENLLDKIHDLLSLESFSVENLNCFNFHHNKTKMILVSKFSDEHELKIAIKTYIKFYITLLEMLGLMSDAREAEEHLRSLSFYAEDVKEHCHGLKLFGTTHSRMTGLRANFD